MDTGRFPSNVWDDDDGELAVGKYVVQWAGHKLAIILLYNDIF